MIFACSYSSAPDIWHYRMGKLQQLGPFKIPGPTARQGWEHEASFLGPLLGRKNPQPRSQGRGLANGVGGKSFILLGDEPSLTVMEVTHWDSIIQHT